MRNNYILIRFGIRYLSRRIGQTLLLALGILLGVSVVVAVDYANEGSRKALELSTQSIIGRATHQITSVEGGIKEEEFAKLMRSGVLEAASPIVEAYVNVIELEDRTFLLFGIDPISDYPFREYYQGSNVEQGQSMTLLSQPGSVILSLESAFKYNLALGDEIHLGFEGREIAVTIAGLIQASSNEQNQALQGLIITDIASAQEILGKEKILDRIEVILDTQDEIDTLNENLSEFLMLSPANEQSEQINNLVSAFQVNLTALSLLALVVGVYLIYNTMTFSVIQRRELIGLMRGIGFYKREIFFVIIFEATMIGIVGTFFGLLAGVLMGKQTVNLVLQTINDLYFVTTVRDVSVSQLSLIKGALLGIGATVLATIPPALEATRVTPRMAGIRSSLEKKAQGSLGRSFVFVLITFAAGLFFLFLPIFKTLWWSFFATLLFVIGFSILSAICLELLLPSIARFLRKYFGLFAGMAARELYRSLSRTAIAIAALMVAISVTIGMGLMIGSFRNTVQIWLDETLSGNIYVSVPGQQANNSAARIDEQILETIEEQNGIKKIDYLFSTEVSSANGDLLMSVVSNVDIAKERLFKQKQDTIPVLREYFEAGYIFVSEPLANRLNVRVGDSIPIQTTKGQQEYPIAGIFFDYSSNQGYFLMEKNVYLQNWPKFEATTISLMVEDESRIQDMVWQLQKATNQNKQKVMIRDNETLKKNVMEIFDRTFTVTHALRFIATLVSFIGILSAILLILLDKKQEFGVLKALGVQSHEFWRLILFETGLMGLFAGIFAIPTGIVISYILIYIINLRSFGWTLQIHLDGLLLLNGVIFAVLAAMAAGIYPTIRLIRLRTIQVLHNE